MLSSLPLQVLIFFHAAYSLAFTVAMTALFAWKGVYFPYPGNMNSLFGLELAMLYVLQLLELMRLFLGSRGNKLEQTGPLLWFLILSVPSCLAFVYYLQLQMYVTRADQVFSAISVVFLGLEVIFALLATFTFLKAARSSTIR